MMSPSAIHPPSSSLDNDDDSFNVQFGTVGEGSSRRVLAFCQLQAISTALSKERSDWVCQCCNYENRGDSAACSMCGSSTGDGLPSTSNQPVFLASESRASKTLPLEESMKWPSAFASRHNDTASTTGKSWGKILKEESMKWPSVFASPQNTATIEESFTITSLASLSVIENGGWTCPDCTFANTNSMHLTCGVCGREKPPSNETDGSKGNPASNHMSVTEFLTTSMRHIGDDEDSSFKDTQLRAYYKFEDTAVLKRKVSIDARAQMRSLRAFSQNFSLSSNNEEKISESDICKIRAILNEGRLTLKSLEDQYEKEKKEHDIMVQNQAEMEIMISEEEGISPRISMNSSATRPGIQRISPAVLEWHGQQGMLDDWSLQLKERQNEIQQLRTHQEESLQLILK